MRRGLWTGYCLHHLTPDPGDTGGRRPLALDPYVMDVSAILSKSNQEVPTFFMDSVHFSASGHRVVGGALGQTIALTSGRGGVAPSTEAIQVRPEQSVS